MLAEEERERIRRAYHLDHQRVAQIARDTGHCRQTIQQALDARPRKPYQMKRERSAPTFKPFQPRVEALLQQNAHLPPKQRYTVHRIFEILQEEGYQGCESRIGQFCAEWRRHPSRAELFLPLEFEPGQDAQCDWGTAIAIIGGRWQTCHVFVLRLCYSRRTFVMAFPSEQQESFLSAHVQAFKHFGGVPHRISYDNLTTAVKLVFDKTQERHHQRHENRTFVAFRSHYLFESHFCTPGQGHEKGQVENGVGFARRNCFVPLPQAASFEALNQQLAERCLTLDERQMRGKQLTVGQAGEEERPHLRPLPAFDYECCQRTTARLTPYSQVVFETNRYSVPVRRARREVAVKAYPFQVEIWDREQLVAQHPRCYEREQDIFDPLHYLPLLEQRPGAFDYAAPMRRWRKDWPPCYHQMLRELRKKWPEEGRGVQEFVRILQLHEQYAAPLMQGAIEQALAYGCVHLDGVLYCLHQISDHPPTATEEPVAQSLEEVARQSLDAIATQPVDLSRYEQLLKLSW
jgi:transposase